jgi:hypothetical protein
MMRKNSSIILRISQEDNLLLDVKSKILKTNKSQLLLNGAFNYWNGSDKEWSDKLLKLYQESDTNKSHIVNMVFAYYRRTGYPHRKLSNQDMIKIMHTLSSTKNPLIGNDHLQTNNVGIPVASCFHPHMMKVRCLSRYLSPSELYNNDEKFKDAINRCFELGNKPNEANIRRILRTRDGVRSAVNFKPVIAKYIYQNYAPTGGKVLDPCAGYGGRLTGLISTNKNLLYHGIDPCPETTVGNTQLAAFYSRLYEPITKELQWKFRFRHDLGCAEDVLPTLPDKEYDLVFTSPPYFNVEQYDTLPNQSYLRYPDYESWRDKFLSVLIKESCRVSKQYVVLNVKNYKSYPIADDALKFAEQMGYGIHKTYQMRLANSEFHRRESEPTYHVEPIYVLL